MSSRALRRLKGKQRGQEPLGPEDITARDSPEEQLETANVTALSNRNRKAKKNKAQKDFSNIYEVVMSYFFQYLF